MPGNFISERGDENDMTFSEILLPEFDEEMRSTRKLLELVPDDKFNFKPHPKSMELGYLANHVAQLPGWAATAIDLDVFELNPGDRIPQAPNRAGMLEIFDKSVADAKEKIAATSDEKWGQTWTFKFGGKTMMSEPRWMVMRRTVLDHLIHHRAQLGVYLRLNEIAIPGMYGPSADEARFWDAAA